MVASCRLVNWFPACDQWLCKFRKSPLYEALLSNILFRDEQVKDQGNISDPAHSLTTDQLCESDELGLMSHSCEALLGKNMNKVA